MGRLIYILCAFLFGIQLLAAQRPNWVVNESLFQQSATMICSANINGVYLNSPNDLVAAFVGNECRGVVKPLFVPGAGRHLFFLVIFSNTQGETISFRVYNSATDKVFDIDAKLNFQINQQVGSLFQPFSLAFPRLRSEASLLNFDLSNIAYDSMINRVDIANGLTTYNFHIRFGQKKDSAVFVYRVSSGAKLFLNQVEVVSGITVVDQRSMCQFQVKSEDEASLTTFNVNLINAASPPVCEDTANNNPRPRISVNKIEFCVGDSALLTSTPAARYLWSNGDTTGSIRVKIGGSFTVTAIYANGCRSTSTVQSITVNAKPASPIVTNLSVCLGSVPEQLSATATVGNTLRWYGTMAIGGNASNAPPSLTTNSVGVTNFYVSQMSAQGCEGDRSTIVYTVNPKPAAPVVANIGVCKGGTVPVLSASALGGHILRWYGTAATGGTPTNTPPVVSSVNTGVTNYYVSQVNLNGCESDRALLLFTVNALPTKPLINWNGVVLSATQTYVGYQWLLNNNPVPAAINIQHRPLVAGSYRLVVSNIENCTDTSMVIDLLVTSLGNIAPTNRTPIIYPNPILSSAILDLSLEPIQSVELRLIDSYGKIIKYWNGIRQRKFILQLFDVQSGTYWLQIHYGNQIRIVKLFKN